MHVMKRAFGWTALGLAIATLACNDGRDDPFSAMTAPATASVSTSVGVGTDTPTSSAGTSDSDSNSGVDDDDDGTSDGTEGSATNPSGPVLDVNAPGTTTGECIEGEECDEGCTAVDLLFVIDNSLSMETYQIALGQAFPTFADAIIDVLPEGINLHVGVTSTEMGYSNEGDTMNCTATGAGGQPSANFYVTPDTMPSATNGAQGRLYNAGGMPFFDIDTDAPPAQVQALKDWFAAASNIGENGSNVEMSAAAAGWMADPVNAATNAGFIRDEGAVLVLFFIQDEPDQTPPEHAQLMIQKITAAKQACGGFECVVGGGFVNQFCLAQVPLGDMFNSMGADPVVAVLPDEDLVTPMTFEPVLREALAQVIAEKCDEIEPPA